MEESTIIRNLKARCPSNASVMVGIGDDAAVLTPSAMTQLVCKDMLMDGVHFLVAEHPAALIGRKALAVNLSDIAAMGGQPGSAYIALALPRSLCVGPFLDSLYSGIEELARSFEVAVAGGDTNIWDGPLVISVTVLGACHAKGAITRSGAQAGDLIYVTGPLGDSYASGHHLNFQPRLREAALLMEQLHLHAMIDVSDGLGKDLRVLAEASGLQAVLERAQIPVRSTLKKLTQAAALERALDDGEDFELCFTLSPADAHRLDTFPGLPACTRIGSMQAGTGLYWDDQTPIRARGYEHRS